MSIPTPTLKLNNGKSIPALGFGTFAKDGSPGLMQAATIAALDAGYRHLDCAWMYGNEDEIGTGIREFLSKNPSVKREDIFVTTKVWCHNFEPEDVEWSINDSLKKFGLDYVDCLLLHWPFIAERTEDHQIKKDTDGKHVPKKDQNLEPTWRAMEKLNKSGKAKSIGVSNWSIGRLEKLLSYATIKPVINQIEIHPYFPNTELVKYCFSQDILPVAYSPLGSQIPDGESGMDALLESSELKAIAAKKGVSLAQLLISWGVKRGYAVLPKSSTTERIKSNFELVDLSEEEFEGVNKLGEGRNKRYVEAAIFNYDVFGE